MQAGLAVKFETNWCISVAFVLLGYRMITYYGIFTLEYSQRKWTRVSLETSMYCILCWKKQRCKTVLHLISPATRPIFFHRNLLLNIFLSFNPSTNSHFEKKNTIQLKLISFKAYSISLGRIANIPVNISNYNSIEWRILFPVKLFSN